MSDMKSEYLKYLTALISVAAAMVTFFVFAYEFKGSVIDPKVLAIAAIGASAYAAFFSLYLSRRLERRRMKQRIFIIYSHKDKEKAGKITEQLKELGYNPWFDQQEILPGQKWTKAINQAIEDSAVALFLSSKNTEEEGGYIKNEMKAAMEVLRAKGEGYSPVIPVYLEESSLPEELKGIHAVKYFEESGLETLNKGLKYIFESST